MSPSRVGFSLIREKNLPREGCLQPVSQVKEPELGLVKAISEAPLLGGGWGRGGCGRPGFPQLPAADMIRDVGRSHCQFPSQHYRDNARERRDCDQILFVMTAEMLLGQDVLARPRNEV